MKFAIIAAGEGSRLQQEGVHLPKPLVTLHGEPLIDRLIRIFRRCGAAEVNIIVNQRYPEVAAHLRQLSGETGMPEIRLVVKDTPSSMHSFFELSPFLATESFCLTTVDTIFREEEFTAYVRAFQRDADYDGMMAVTEYVDDEKPLYVATDSALNITGFHDARAEADRYVSGGIYCLRPSALQPLRRCMECGVSRMRNFQRALVADKQRLKACPFSKILDVDHVSDIRKAEEFLAARP